MAVAVDTNTDPKATNELVDDFADDDPEATNDDDPKANNDDPKATTHLDQEEMTWDPNGFQQWSRVDSDGCSELYAPRGTELLLRHKKHGWQPLRAGSSRPMRGLWPADPYRSRGPQRDRSRSKPIRQQQSHQDSDRRFQIVAAAVDSVYMPPPSPRLVTVETVTLGTLTPKRVLHV